MQLNKVGVGWGWVGSKNCGSSYNHDQISHMVCLEMTLHIEIVHKAVLKQLLYEFAVVRTPTGVLLSSSLF